jgi:hypothetical protein
MGKTAANGKNSAWLWREPVKALARGSDKSSYGRNFVVNACLHHFPSCLDECCGISQL